jgi:hypothetical protein
VPSLGGEAPLMSKVDPTKFDNVALGNKPEERARQTKKHIEEFTEKHPLARMHQLHAYLTWAREDRSWKMFAQYTHEFASCYANLPTAQKAVFEDVLPYKPDVLGELSTWAWIAYVASLRAHQAGWERLGATIRRAIVEGWGEDFLPAVFRTLSTVDFEEPPF